MMMKRMTELQQDLENYRSEHEKRENMYEEYERENSILGEKIRELNIREAQSFQKSNALESKITQITDEYSAAIKNLSQLKVKSGSSSNDRGLAAEIAELTRKKNKYKQAVIK
jgi:DNA-binding ferritin-like protein